MPRREVKQVLATYTDDTGTIRYALAGQTVNVHADHVVRFDEANVDTPPPAKKAPKKVARTRGDAPR